MRADRLSELNVKEQVVNLCKSAILQRAWANGSTIKVHGWLCDINTGLIKELETRQYWDSVKDLFTLEFEKKKQ